MRRACLHWKEEQLTEVCWSSRRHDFPGGASLEEDWLLSRTSAECKGADCRGRLVFVCGKEVVQALMAESIQEPLAAQRKGINRTILLLWRWIGLFGQRPWTKLGR